MAISNANVMSVEACYQLTSKPMAKIIPDHSIIYSYSNLKMRPRSTSTYKNRSPYKNGATCCKSIRSQYNDDREPVIDPDWRSFRAKLVANQQQISLAQPNSEGAGTDQPTLDLSDKWVHPLHEPEKGCLLISTDKLDGVHIFEKTVVLLLSAGPIGPSGIILNRPSLMSIKETRSTALDVAGIFSNQPLYFGGPLEDGLFLVNPQEGEKDGVGKSGVFEEVLNGLYYGTKESVGCAAEMVKRNVLGLEDFRFFDGYCGWEKEQLNEEIRAGYWTLVASSPNVIGLNSAGSVGLWEEILGLIGQRKVW